MVYKLVYKKMFRISEGKKNCIKSKTIYYIKILLASIDCFDIDKIERLLQINNIYFKLRLRQKNRYEIFYGFNFSQMCFRKNMLNSPQGISSIILNQLKIVSHAFLVLQKYWIGFDCYYYSSPRNSYTTFFELLDLRFFLGFLAVESYSPYLQACQQQTVIG